MKPYLREDRFVSRVPAGHARRVRRGRALSGTRGPDLRHDDRLADAGRFRRHLQKRRRIAHAFEEQQDHIGVVVMDHVVEEIGNAEIDLVAGADNIRKA